VTGGLRGLHNEELKKIYFSSSISISNEVKEDEMDRTCSTHGRTFDAYWILWETQTEKTTRKT
jgi:hypothetical protein